MKRTICTSRPENLRNAAKSYGVTVRRSRNPSDPSDAYVIEGPDKATAKLVAHFNEEPQK